MTYATTTPAMPVFGLRREIDRLFEDAFRIGQAGRGDWSPAVDVRETDHELVFAIEIPGVGQSDVQVTLENGVLTVRGERLDDRKEGEEWRYHLAERGFGSFIRRFQLPQGMNDQAIKADVVGGMLYVHVQKAAVPEPRQIQITTLGDAGKHAQKVLAGVGSAAQAPAKGNKTLHAK